MDMRASLLMLATAVGAGLGQPGFLSAQIRIDGQVIDNANLEPIVGVEVRVSTARGHRLGTVFTNDQGVFSFTVTEDGGYVFNASRVGYQRTETPILWTDGFQVYEVEIRLDPKAVLLAPIEVLARSRRYESPILEGFRERLRAGFGHYLTLEDIRRIRPSRVSDLLSNVPGVQLQSSGAGLQRVVTMRRDCRAEIFVDGMLLTPDIGGATAGPGFTVDDAVSSGSVLGIEVYRGLSTVPAEFLTPRARCGVVVIWTRRSGD
ncbi:MAG TPA: carboxypeptidase regulatory-like domain-containing protein [Longimicrobiales bacterium]|nr:carboxypeptidase regulatory-like domain-containing protein [Longimicrobiales bacterium]